MGCQRQILGNDLQLYICLLKFKDDYEVHQIEIGSCSAWTWNVVLLIVTNEFIVKYGSELMITVVREMFFHQLFNLLLLH